MLIGTAGHVDHGKTTLIKALTGIDADRLPEEKQRGMTIDVGFAHLDFEGIGRVSIIDVPGHERFIHNMLVGALGIDVALLCVASDEAVMPQTREHLQILDLLPIDRLVVALTRADLADDETRTLARMDVEELVERSRFKDSPILEVSAVTGEGLPGLLDALKQALKATTPKEDPSTPWYMPIDRAFSAKGHGVVVTGTLANGTVRVGDTAFLEPGHLEVRVRAIQSHGQTKDSGAPRNRTALNLSGVKLEDVQRGMAIGGAGALFTTRVLDGRVRWLEEPKHGSRVRVSLGAEEAIAKAFMNDHDPDLLQLRFETPVACAVDQPFILRQYSPPVLLGGGRVTVPQARTRRKGESVAEVRRTSNLDEAILETLGRSSDGMPTDEVCRRLGRTPQALGDVFEQMMKSGRVRGFAGLWFSREGFEEATARFLEGLDFLHKRQPGLAVIPREKVVQAAKLPWAGKPLDKIIAELAAMNLITVSGTSVRDAKFRPELPPRQRQLLDRALQALVAERVNVPGAHDIAKAIAVPAPAVEEILKVGVQAGEIVQIAEGVYYTPDQIAGIKDLMRELVGDQPFAAGELRDAMGTTRKYMIPLLEYFDAQRFTIRVGDRRVIKGR